MNYIDIVKPRYLSSEFLFKYINRQSPLKDIGLVVNLRTYSRFIPELKRREKWWEICLRVTEYSVGLAKDLLSYEELVKEAEEMYEAIYNLEVLPAGRSLWIAGTEQVKEDGSPNWNCTYSNVDSISSFSDMMYWLMLGSGTGFSVEKELIDKLPTFYPYNKTIKYINFESSIRGKEDTHLDCGTSFFLLNQDYLINGNPLILSVLNSNSKIKISIGDSKTGWCTALRVFMELLTVEKELEIEVNFYNVRPPGQKIAKFGGRSSGPIPLKNMLEGIFSTIKGKEEAQLSLLEDKNKPVRLSSVQCLDICNYIGKSIVSGGVRRTSQLAASTPDDIEFITSKKDLWTDETKADVRNIRTMSNNSIMYDKRPSLLELRELMNTIRTNGDPGFWNRENSRKANGDNINHPVMGTNPCLRGDMELLTDKGYIPIKDLANKEVVLINKDGVSSRGTVWYSGRKSIVQINFTKKVNSLYCTADHRWMTHDGESVKAKDLKDKRLKYYCESKNMYSSTHPYSYETFKDLINNGAEVENICQLGEDDVYDFSEPLTNWGIVQGFISHNCGEAALDNKNSCNLSTTNLTACLLYNPETNRYEINWDKLTSIIKIATRIGSRQTLASQWHPEWDKTQKRDRLLGVSFTGYGDFIELLGDVPPKEEAFINRRMKEIAVTEADRYHDQLGINHSARVTLIKPSGTLSLLMDTSSGVHDSYAPYYLRRVRFSRYDPLALALKDAGLSPSPENGQGEDLRGYRCDTWVFTFPMTSKTSRRAIDVPVLEQLERYKTVQINYCDRGHNVSQTCTVAEHEWDDVAAWLYLNWNDVIGITLLGRFDPKEGGQAAYPQMPLETCTKEEYEDLMISFPYFTEEGLLNLISQYETVYEEHEIIEKDCEGGACPIR